MIPRVAAVVGPVVVVAAWVAVVGVPDEPDRGTVREWSGFDGDKAGLEAVTQLVKRVDAGASVAVIGNSQAAAMLDADGLGAGLGLERGEVVVAGMPGARAPTLYAALAHRVLDAEGPRPRVVILPVALDHLLDTTPPGPQQARAMAQIAPGGDPVIESKVHHRTGWLGEVRSVLDRVTLQAQTQRDALLAWVTTAPLRLTGHDDADTRMAEAREHVFGSIDGQNFVLNVRTMPVVEAGADAVSAVGIDARIETSLLPDILALAEQVDVRVVVVLPPQRDPRLRAGDDDVRAVAAWLGSRGAGFVDLQAHPIPAEGWLDVGHVNMRGRTVAMSLVTDALLQLDVLGSGPLRPLGLPLPPPSVTLTPGRPAPSVLSVVPTTDPCVVELRTDAPPELADAPGTPVDAGFVSPLTVSVRGVALQPHVRVSPGGGCTGQFMHIGGKVLASLPEGVIAPVVASDVALGWVTQLPYMRRIGRNETEDAWWVPSGGAVTWRYDGVGDLASGTTVRALVSVLGQSDDSATLAAGGASATLVPWGRLAFAEVPVVLDGAGDTASLSVSLSVREGGADVLVRALLLHGDGPDRVLVGDPLWHPDRLALVGAPGVTITPPSPPLRVIDDTPERDGETLVFAAEGLDARLVTSVVGDLAAERRFGKNCLPFEAVASTPEGPSLPLRQEVAGVLRTVGALPPDPLVARVRASRLCMEHWWVAPGETVGFAVRSLGPLQVTADVLELRAGAIGLEPTSRIGVRVTPTSADGDAPPVVDTQVAVSSMDGSVIRLPLSGPLGPASKEVGSPSSVRLDVTAPTDAWLYLRRADLVASVAPPDAWFVAPTELPVAALGAPAEADVVPAVARPDTAPLATLAGVDLAALRRLPAGTHLVAADVGVRLPEPAGAFTMVCLPDVDLSGGVWVEAEVVAVLADGEAPRGRVMVDARWVDVDGRAVTDTSGRARIDTERVEAPGASPVVVSVTGDAPVGARLRACVRSSDGAPAIDLRRLEVLSLP